MKNEFYDIAFRKKIYRSLEELQIDVDEWLKKYNHHRPHSGKYCYGKTPMQTLLDSKHTAIEKNLSKLFEEDINDEIVSEQDLPDTEVCL